jgi:hypothetical protein
VVEAGNCNAGQPSGSLQREVGNGFWKGLCSMVKIPALGQLVGWICFFIAFAVVSPHWVLVKVVLLAAARVLPQPPPTLGNRVIGAPMDARALFDRLRGGHDLRRGFAVSPLRPMTHH